MRTALDALAAEHGIGVRLPRAASRSGLSNVACLASRRRAHALIQARQRAQQHAFIFTHADLQPICSMIMLIAEQWLLACSKRNRRENTTRATPPFS
jgi:hypothetical protein